MADNTAEPDAKSEDVEERQRISEMFPDDDTCDVALIVQSRKFFISKAVISVISPVFRRMFESDFKEKDCKEILLPEKTAEEMEEFLGVIYPTVMKSLQGCDIFSVLKLAEEYQVNAIKKRCADTLTRKVKDNGAEIPLEDLLQMLLAADTYDFRELTESILPLLSNQFYAQVEKTPFYAALSDKMKLEITKLRIKTLEPLFLEGQLSEHIRQLVPCKTNHRVKRRCESCKSNTLAEFNCETEHRAPRAYEALDCLLCHYLRSTPSDMSTTVDWLKFAKETNFPKAVKMIQESASSKQVSVILKKI